MTVPASGGAGPAAGAGVSAPAPGGAGRAGGAARPLVDIVVPTAGRRTLANLLRGLDRSVARAGRGTGPGIGRVLVVDDRPGNRPGSARQAWAFVPKRARGFVPRRARGFVPRRFTSCNGLSSHATRLRGLPRGSRGLLSGSSAPPVPTETPTPPELPLPPDVPALAGRIHVLRGTGGGPAAARNVGWRASRADWIAFLDDDVVPDPDWLKRLAVDLTDLDPAVAGSQGRVRVPLPSGRRPTDWERNVAGLEHARWATADLAYRRVSLEAVDGFDERFPRAYREDADLGLRLERAGRRIVRGRREVAHPVRPAGPLVSVRLQAGNADDALMRGLHGPGWRRAAGAPRGRLPGHLVTTAAGALALAAAGGGRRRLAACGAGAWALATAEFALRRIAPGPRTAREVATMLLTSALIPPAATAHRAAGEIRARRLLAAARPAPPPEPPAAVLLDRDGTLIADVPYNGDPERVAPMPGARVALDRLRRAGLPLAVVSNQSGVGRGLLTPERVEVVNRRVEELLGPIGSWAVCPHGPDEGCGCRKPAPGLVLRAAAALGVAPERCALVGDIGADVEAARAAGARGVLVPTPMTRPEEVEAAPEVAPDIEAAVDLLLGKAG